MKQLSAHIGFVTSEGTHERQSEKLRRDLGEVFLAALADPATVGILLNADGTLWQGRLREPEPWRPIETMIASRVEAALRTVDTITCEKPKLEVEFPLERSRFSSQIPPVVPATPTKSPVVAKPSSLMCACCKPKPLQAAPKPLFRLCPRKIWLIRSCLKSAEREEHVRLGNARLMSVPED
jgi:hypothetical protein